MREILAWVNIVLVFGGILLAMGGLMWRKTAQLLLVLGLRANPDAGLRVTLIGLAITALGFLLVFLTH